MAGLEQLPPTGGKGWGHDEVQLVDQVRLQESLGQGDAAVNPDVLTRQGLQPADVLDHRLVNEHRVRPGFRRLAGREHVLHRPVDEVGEGLHVRRRPVARPVVVGAAAEQHRVLSSDDRREVADHRIVDLAHPVARFLRDAVQRHQLVQNDPAHDPLLSRHRMPVVVSTYRAPGNHRCLRVRSYWVCPNSVERAAEVQRILVPRSGRLRAPTPIGT